MANDEFAAAFDSVKIEGVTERPSQFNDAIERTEALEEQHREAGRIENERIEQHSGGATATRWSMDDAGDAGGFGRGVIMHQPRPNHRFGLNHDGVPGTNRSLYIDSVLRPVLYTANADDDNNSNDDDEADNNQNLGNTRTPTAVPAQTTEQTTPVM